LEVTAKSTKKMIVYYYVVGLEIRKQRHFV